MPPDRNVWRLRVAPILTAPPISWNGACDVDPTWGVSGATGPGALSPDGWFYYVERNGSLQAVRRIRLDSGAVPDPGLSIALPASVQIIAGIAAGEGFVYLSLWNGGNDFRLTRYSTITGQVDPDWPNIARLDGFGGFAIDANWLYAWEAGPLTASGRIWELTRRSLIDGRLAGVLRAVESTLPLDAGHPAPAVTATGDGRAIATWRFVALDGVPRDGFAIVGSVEAILADGFEAR